LDFVRGIEKCTSLPRDANVKGMNFKKPHFFVPPEIGIFFELSRRPKIQKNATTTTTRE
jgi:hypothetical protein